MNKTNQRDAIPGLTAREVKQMQRVGVIVETLRSRIALGARKGNRLGAIDASLITLISDAVDKLTTNDSKGDLYSSISEYQQAFAINQLLN